MTQKLLLILAFVTLSPVPRIEAAEPFTRTGDMRVARLGHTATLLPNGQVLIAGGCCSANQALRSAELYDPITGTFSLTGNMTVARDRHSATLLTNGTVLIAGGYDYSGTESFHSAEIYNPNTGTFSPTGSMIAPYSRMEHSAIRLPNGSVLLAGGNDIHGDPLQTAEVYNPATGTFTATGSLSVARWGNAGALLPNGMVLIAGGQLAGPAQLSSAEIYNPTTGTFSPTGSMLLARRGHLATLLPNGKVLIEGGPVGAGVRQLAELYDPSTGTFSRTGDLLVGRYLHTATVLQNGKVFLSNGWAHGISTPGYPERIGEIYDPTTGLFSPAGTMLYQRWSGTATLLLDGRVLLTGGRFCCTTSPDNFIWNSAEIYDPTIPLTLSLAQTAQPTSGAAPLTTTVTATVSGTAVGPLRYSFWWNCGDTRADLAVVMRTCGNPDSSGIGEVHTNISGNTQVATHIYVKAGTYTAKTLVQRGALTAEGRATITVRVAYPAPAADFTWEPVAPVANQPMHFTDTSRGGPTQWFWSFGDGRTSTAQNPDVTFEAAGDYVITLSVVAPGGASSRQKMIRVLAYDCGTAPCITIHGEVQLGNQPVLGTSDFARNVAFINVADPQHGSFETSISAEGSFDARIRPGDYLIRAFIEYAEYGFTGKIRERRHVTAWDGPVQLSESGTRILRLPVPIAFVHGWLGSPGTWTDWRDWLAEHKPDIITFAPSYTYCGATYESEAIDVALQLSDDINALVGPAGEWPRYHLVAHSKGGLVARVFDNLYHDFRVGRLETIIMLGTPNSGAACGELADLACPGAANLTPAAVASLGVAYPHFRTARVRVVAGTRHDTICAEQPNDLVVSARSAMTIATSGDVVRGTLAAVDHFGLRNSIGILADIILPYLYDDAGFPQCPASLDQLSPCLANFGYSGPGTCQLPGPFTPAPGVEVTWNVDHTGTLQTTVARATSVTCGATSASVLGAATSSTGFTVYRVTAGRADLVGFASAETTRFVDLAPPAGVHTYRVASVDAEGREGVPVESAPVLIPGRRRVTQ